MIKKLLAVSVSAVMMLAMSVSAFAAGSINDNEQKILDELNAKKVPAEYVSQATNYVQKDNVDITADEASKIIAHIDNAAKIVSDAGIKTAAELKNNKDILNKVIAEANQAAAVIGVTLTVDVASGKVTAVDSTNKPQATSNGGTIKNTGADSTSTVAVVSVLGLAVAALAVVTKKNAEA